MVVYKITNIINNKIYIGCAIDYEVRIKAHRSCKYKGALLLHRAFLKYGIDNFAFEVIQNYNTKEDMLQGEIMFIEQYNSISPNGYNLHFGGKGGKIQLTEKQLLQRKQHAKSLTQLHIGNKYNLGRVTSDETKEKISKKLKGQTRTGDTKTKISKSKIGNTNSKGVIRSQDYKDKISNALKGRVFSEEHKQKLSEAAKKRMLNKKRNKNGQFE
jgi:group I intron endonuclease